MERSKARVIEHFVALVQFFAGITIMSLVSVKLCFGMMLFSVGLNTMMRLYLVEKVFKIDESVVKYKKI